MTTRKKALVKDVARKCVMHKNCKICNLIKEYPQLWKDIHKMVLEDGLARAKVCRWLNSKVEIINVDRTSDEKLAPFSGENFRRHFKLHIPTYERVKAELRDKALGKERESDTTDFPATSMAVYDTFVEECAHEQSDYSSITKMIANLEMHMNLYNTYLTEKSAMQKGQLGKRPIALSELNEFKSLVESLTDLKLKVAKIRNSTAVSGAAVRRAVSISVELFLNHLVTSLAEAEQSLIEVIPDSSLPHEVIDKAMNRIATSVKTSLPEILEKIFTEYGIK